MNRLESCFEKQDLINLIESKKRRIPDETYVFVERPNINNNNNNTETINISNHQEVQQPIVNENEQVKKNEVFFVKNRFDKINFFSLQ
jgi:hypothetical protein